MPKGVLHVFVAWVVMFLLPDPFASDAERRFEH